MTNPELPDSVCRLVEAVRGFLENDDGNDDAYIVTMRECVDQIQRDGGRVSIDRTAEAATA